MKSKLLTAAALGALLTAFAPIYDAYADAETEALRAEVKALMTRIDQLEKREKARDKTDATAQKAAALSPSAGGNKSLEQRVSIVERNQELASDDAKAKAETNPKVEVGNGKGFTITSADKQYSFNMRGY